jgi:hypothetical protein
MGNRQASSLFVGECRDCAAKNCGGAFGRRKKARACCLGRRARRIPCQSQRHSRPAYDLTLQYLELARSLSSDVTEATSMPRRVFIAGDTEDDYSDPMATDSSAPKPPFYVWLLVKQNKPTKLAEIARHVADDSNFPRDASIEEQRSYLKSSNCPAKLCRQFNAAYASYSGVGRKREPKPTSRRQGTKVKRNDQSAP